MKLRRLHVRPSSKCGSTRWVVEKQKIITQSKHKITFEILSKKWFDNEFTATWWANIHGNKHNIPVKVGYSY
jgi:hypothetical protein